MGDVGEGSAVNEGGGALEGLDKVRFKGVFKKGGHGAGGLELAAGYGLVVIGVADNDAGKALFKVSDGVGKAENRHNLAGDGDVEAVLSRGAVCLAAETVNDEAKLAVVHIDAAFPGDFPNVNAEGVALLNVVVEHRRKKVVGGADGVKVAGEVEVDVLHRHYLGVAAAGGAALYAEDRTEGGLAKGDGDVLADAAKSVRKTYGGGGFSLACGGGGDGGDKNELAVLLFALA